MGRVLIVLGVVIALVGLVIVLGGKLGLGRLPGDIVVERKGFSLYAPVATSIVVSVVLTLIVNLLLRRR